MDLIPVLLPSTTPFSLGVPTLLMWHGHRDILFPFTAFRVSEAYKNVLGRTARVIRRSLAAEFPNYDAVEHSGYSGPFVPLEPINIETKKLDVMQLPTVLEENLFFDPFNDPRYVYIQSDQLDYMTIFRIVRNRGGRKSSVPSYTRTTIDKVPVFNPSTDDIVIVSNKFVETIT